MTKQKYKQRRTKLCEMYVKQNPDNWLMKIIAKNVLQASWNYY